MARKSQGFSSMARRVGVALFRRHRAVHLLHRPARRLGVDIHRGHRPRVPPNCGMNRPHQNSRQAAHADEDKLLFHILASC